MHGDGSGLRKLTDDPHRDRAPAWFPDGESIVFYSNRTGRYELWSMRIDGSGARQLTEFENAASLWYPAISHDGKKLAAHNSEVIVIYDLDEEVVYGDDDGFELPPHEDGVHRRSNPRWSPDSRYLPLWTIGGDEITFYDVERGSWVDFDAPGSPTGLRAGSWLSDGRAVMYGDGERRGSVRDPAVYVLDLETGAFTPILERWERPADLRQLAITADSRWLYYLVTESEADIWTARLE